MTRIDGASSIKLCGRLEPENEEEQRCALRTFAGW
jgi:hypothetical protein